MAISGICDGRVVIVTGAGRGIGHALEFASRAPGRVDGRLINTTSVSETYGNPGRANYGAAKAGIASFTICSPRPRR